MTNYNDDTPVVEQGDVIEEQEWTETLLAVVHI